MTAKSPLRNFASFTQLPYKRKNEIVENHMIAFQELSPCCQEGYRVVILFRFFLFFSFTITALADLYALGNILRFKESVKIIIGGKTNA